MRSGAAFAVAAWASLVATGTLAHDESGNHAKSPLVPGVEFFVDDAYRALPVLEFPIEKLTNVERRIYVQADASKHVDHAVIVQFEHVQAGSDFRFVYPPVPPQRFGRHDLRFGAFAFDEAAAAAADPGREAGRTRAHLQQQGYVIPRYWRAARLARVADAEGLVEVIVFYLENADTDYSAKGLTGADEGGDLTLPAAEAERLLGRLRSAVSVVSD